MAESLIVQLLRTRSLWIVLVLVLAAELVVRGSLPAGKIPRGAYHSSEYRHQVESYPDALPVNMMIIGSSVAAVNYPPVPLDEQLAELGQTGFTTYNAGIRGCNYECIATGIRRNYLEVFQPPVALLVIDPADLDIDNKGVVARSKQFADDIQRNVVSRTARQLLSSISRVYGFKEEVRSWLLSGAWEFDPSVLGERGYVDMGSTDKGRDTTVARITQDSELSRGLVSLVTQLSETGTQVILLPVVGDSLANLLFTDQARSEFRQLLDSMVPLDNVHELTMDMNHIPDSSYIDTLHLDSQTAIANSRALADSLVQSGLLNLP